MAAPTKDRFDQVPADLTRVGAHRAPARRGRRWIAVAWAALASLVLVIAGLFALSILVDDFRLPFLPSQEDATPPGADGPGEEAPPMIDPTLAITVLNGTPTTGLAGDVGDYLVAQGWDGAELGIGSRLAASTSDVPRTLVFYSDPDNEAAARAMVQTLGVGELRLSNSYPASPLTVLLGADFALPLDLQ